MSDRRFIIDAFGRNRLWRAHGTLDCALADTDMVSTWRVDLAGALIVLARRLIGAEAGRYTREQLDRGEPVNASLEAPNGPGE